MASPSLAHRIRIEAHALWLAARDPRTPRPAKLFALLIAAYALSPIDLIPDFIPVIGLLDDAVLVPFGIWLFEKMAPPGQFAEHRAAAEATPESPKLWFGAVIVIALWAIALWLTWTTLVWIYD